MSISKCLLRMQTFKHAICLSLVVATMSIVFTTSQLHAQEADAANEVSISEIKAGGCQGE